MPIEFPATRWSLIARLASQPEHITVIVGLYADAISVYLHRRLAAEHHDRLEDVVQDVLLDLLRKPEVIAKAQPGSGSRFRYYLMNMAWKSALNTLRSLRRRDRPSLDASTTVDEHALVDDVAGHMPAPDHMQDMDRAWALSVVHQAVDELRHWSHSGVVEPEAFSILHANLVEGRALRDISAQLGLPLGTCHRRLARARTLLQEAIVQRLRLAGELGRDEDPTLACALMLSLVDGPRSA
jgi:RNA polymerase sigma factor (sigma-70 family)